MQLSCELKSLVLIYSYRKLNYLYDISCYIRLSFYVHAYTIGKRIREIISIIVFAVLSAIALMKLAESTDSPFNPVTASSLIVATSMLII